MNDSLSHPLLGPEASVLLQRSNGHKIMQLNSDKAKREFQVA